jgi:hypothetical protein
MSENHWYVIGYRHEMGMPEGHDHRIHANGRNMIMGHNEYGNERRPVYYWRDQPWTPSRWTSWSSMDAAIAHAARRRQNVVLLDVERSVPFDRRGESPMPHRTVEQRRAFSLAEARRLRDSIRPRKEQSAASRRAWKNRRFWDESNKRKYI